MNVHGSRHTYNVRPKFFADMFRCGSDYLPQVVHPEAVHLKLGISLLKGGTVRAESCISE